MSKMQYRKLPHGEEQISILGLGTSSMQTADEVEIGLINKYYDLSQAGMSLPTAIIKSWKRRPPTVWNVDIVITAVRSMWIRWQG